MQAVAERYHYEYESYPIIAINDLAVGRDGSGGKGGIFDLNRNWGPPHYRHSRGTAVDVRGNGGPNSVPRIPEVQARFLEICQEWGATYVRHEDIGTENEHFHCEWPS
jgi:hypothetical protein